MIGAAKGMALNITYSAWAVVFGFVILGNVPGVVEIVCCFLIMGGTVLAASDWKELFSRRKKNGSSKDIENASSADDKGQGNQLQAQAFPELEG